MVCEIKGEWFLKFWGQIRNDNLVEKELGISDTNFWFNTEQERESFKEKLSAIADRHKVVIAFSEENGPNVRYRTVAHMTMSLPDGREYPFEYDFGYGYPEDSAVHMFEDGNYSCDCNKSMFLNERYPEVSETGCGDEIAIKELRITLEE